MALAMLAAASVIGSLPMSMTAALAMAAALTASIAPGVAAGIATGIPTSIATAVAASAATSATARTTAATAAATATPFRVRGGERCVAVHQVDGERGSGHRDGQGGRRDQNGETLANGYRHPMAPYLGSIARGTALGSPRQAIGIIGSRAKRSHNDKS
jgi:hypothetical protein